jgi:hypothetical protein
MKLFEPRVIWVPVEKTPEEKFCKDCKWQEKAKKGVEPHCMRPKPLPMVTLSDEEKAHYLVTGIAPAPKQDNNIFRCSFERRDQQYSYKQYCGPEGRFWSPKDPRKKWGIRWLKER